MSNFQGQGVYLYHFTKSHKHARHYIGFSEDVLQRFETHLKGNGNPLVRTVIDSGNTVEFIRFWKGADREFERKLKNRKNAAKLCPICNPRTWKKNGRKPI